MNKEQELDDLVRATLTQLSLELEASSQAAKEAATHLSDKKALWASIQQMYARLNQANSFVDRLRDLADSAAARRRAGDETETS